MVEPDASSLNVSDDADRMTLDASVDDVVTKVGPVPPPLDDGAAPPLFIADSAPVRAASDCKPGTYVGTFVMMVGYAGVTTLTLKGPLSITLEANKPSPHPGEFNSGTLTVAPGAQFRGTDNLGDVITADLSGQLNCGTRMFVGTLTNGVADVFGSDAATVSVDGSMAATYDPSATPVALVSGTFTFTSKQVQGTIGMGQWSATLQ
jgi:hypothetical protein